MTTAFARRRVTLTVILGIVASFLTIAGADETNPDWVLFVATAGDRGASGVTAYVSAEGRVLEGHSMLQGTAFDGGWVVVSPWLSDEARVSTSRALGGQRVTVSPSTTPDVVAVWSVSMSFGNVSLGPNETAAILAFFPGGELTFVSEPSVVDGGSFTTEVITGSGSRALAVGDTGSAEPSVAVGPAGAGLVSHEVLSPTGLVGAFVSDLCAICTISWSGPDGGASATRADPLFDRFNPQIQFHGGPGRWSWAWSGVGVSRFLLAAPSGAPNYVAWAPVGDHWQLLAP